jgi:hypothetical protein
MVKLLILTGRRQQTTGPIAGIFFAALHPVHIGGRAAEVNNGSAKLMVTLDYLRLVHK